MARAAAVILGVLFISIPLDTGPNDQSPQMLCRDADYADLHPTLCPGGFSLTPPLPTGHGGGSGGGGLLGIVGHLL